MILCVGAASRRVVEEAAMLQVPQIIASCRQVAPGGGYIGLDPMQLVRAVDDLSGGKTDVVRDHGGPYQNGDPNDDWVKELNGDVDAGFNVLHLDVCKLPQEEQEAELLSLCGRYKNSVDIEVGGERDPQEWLDVLLNTAMRECIPTFAILDVGGYIMEDRQRGTPRPVSWVEDHTARYNKRGTRTKAHNMDWMGDRRRYAGVLDAYNVAPEYGAVEVDAWLLVLDPMNATKLLNAGYDSGHWSRWFGPHQGTQFDRAKCGLRYMLEDGGVKRILETAGEGGDDFVRGCIRDVLLAG